AGGEVAVPPLRDLGGWSSVNAGTATTYVRSLPLPDGDGVAVLRLRGLAEPVHVAVDGGPERLVMPGAPVIVLEPAEGGGEGGGQVEVAVRAPHVPGGLLDRVELLHARAPRLLDLRTVREAELAELLTEHARTADAVGRHPLPGPSLRPARTERGETAAADPAGGSPAGLHIDAGAPVLIRLAAETGRTAPAGGGALLELDGSDVQVTVIAGGRRVSRHVLGTPATAGGDPRRSCIPAPWRAGAPGPGGWRGAARAGRQRRPGPRHGRWRARLPARARHAGAGRRGSPPLLDPRALAGAGRGGGAAVRRGARGARRYLQGGEARADGPVTGPGRTGDAVARCDGAPTSVETDRRHQWRRSRRRTSATRA